MLYTKYQLHRHGGLKQVYFLYLSSNIINQEKTALEEKERTSNIGEQQPETRFYSVCSCEIMESARTLN